MRLSYRWPNGPADLKISTGHGEDRLEIAYFLILGVAVLTGLPRSLWCIPAFFVMWNLSGGSSGGSDGSGHNIGYLMLPFVVLGVAFWGVYSNFDKQAKPEKGRRD